MTVLLLREVAFTLEIFLDTRARPATNRNRNTGAMLLAGSGPDLWHFKTPLPHNARHSLSCWDEIGVFYELGARPRFNTITTNCRCICVPTINATQKTLSTLHELLRPSNVFMIILFLFLGILPKIQRSTIMLWHVTLICAG